MTRLGSLLALLSCATGATAQTPAATDKVDRFVRAEMTRQRIPGVAVAVLRGDSVLLVQGYGLANLEERVPVTESTLFTVGSVSKQFTAAAVVLLSQQDRLRLDDPITRYLPEGRAVWSGVTIRHLLTHTSGIPQDTTIDPSRDYSDSQLVRSAAQPLEFEPGKLESYSSTGYALLGVIINRVSGRFWGDFVRDHIFGPLGMRTARVNSHTAGADSPAVGYYLPAVGYYLVEGKFQRPDAVSPSVNGLLPQPECPRPGCVGSRPQSREGARPEGS